MSIFNLFGKKATTMSADWTRVAPQLSDTLWHLMNNDPSMLANPFARVVLHDNWSVNIATDKRDPDKILGAHDVSFVFIQENRPALSKWVQELRSNSGQRFQKIATEEYAKTLVRALMQSVEVTD